MNKKVFYFGRPATKLFYFCFVSELFQLCGQQAA